MAAIVDLGVVNRPGGFRVGAAHRTPGAVTTSAGVFAGVQAANTTRAERHQMVMEVDVARGLPTFQMVAVPAAVTGWPSP